MIRIIVPSLRGALRVQLERIVREAELRGDHREAARARCELAWLLMLERDRARRSFERYAMRATDGMEVMRRMRMHLLSSRLFDMAVAGARAAALRAGATT